MKIEKIKKFEDVTEGLQDFVEDTVLIEIFKLIVLSIFHSIINTSKIMVYIIVTGVHRTFYTYGKYKKYS